jgi:O-antigen/teichoic acid export membrane protein
MSLISTEQETGFFGASFRVFIVLTGVAGLLVTSAFPVLARAARDSQQRLGYALQRLFDVSLTLAAWMVIFTALGAPIAIDVVAGPHFDPSVAVLRIQALALLGTFLAAVWGFALLSLHRHSALLIANAVVLVVSSALALTLVPAHGAQGAAVATVAGESVLAIGYAAFLMSHRPDLRVSMSVVPRVAMASALALSPLLVASLGPIVQVTASTAIYAVTLAVLRAIPPEVSHLIRRRS